MLGLSQAQGIILAVGGAIFVAIAGAVLVLRGRARQEADIPNAMRPGPSDPDLETPLLQKLQGWGVVLVLFFVIWMPAVWLLEPEQNLDQEQDLIDDAIARGRGRRGAVHRGEPGRRGVRAVPRPDARGLAHPRTP